MTAIEDLEAGLYGSAFDTEIGDTFRYKPAGGVYADRIGFVDYGDTVRSLEGGQAIEQAMTVEVTKTAVPVKPDAACRVQLTKRPGKTFKPVNIGTDVSGNCWTFELVAVGG